MVTPTFADYVELCTLFERFWQHEAVCIMH